MGLFFVKSDYPTIPFQTNELKTKGKAEKIELPASNPTFSKHNSPVGNRTRM